MRGRGATKGSPCGGVVDRNAVADRIAGEFAAARASRLLVLLASACATSPTWRSQFLLVPPVVAIEASDAAYVGTVAQLRDLEKQVRLLMPVVPPAPYPIEVLTAY